MHGQKIHAIRGMNDYYLPNDTALWQQLEVMLKRVLVSYGYSEIRLPILEQNSLFKRAIGAFTDVVEKEMYSFKDRNGDFITLRPEGTAGCVRAGIEHGLLYNKEQRLWYIGPMFRHERPQKGRYRQFHQLGVEVFGQYGPDIDAELIMLTARMWRALGISKYVSLELNSIGSLEARIHYRQALVSFLSKNLEHLDDDDRRRISVNPMRVLDSKNEYMNELLKKSPVLNDYLDIDSKVHFSGLCKLLDLVDIPYTVNYRLVRGLDYYNHTVFEWITSNLGSQGTICAGGRYDALVEQLGGRATPAVGLAIGMERIFLLVKSVNPSFVVEPSVDAYLVAAGNNVQGAAMQLAEKVRNEVPSLRLITNYGGGSFKKQFHRAYKSGARIALVIGDREAVAKKVILKNLANGHQETLAHSDLLLRLTSISNSSC